MRAVFVLLSALAVQCDEVQVETKADVEPTSDYFTKLLRDGIKSSGLDVVSLPGFSTDLFKLALPRLGPKLTLQEGKLKGLESVQKKDDLILQLGLTFKGDLHLEFKNVIANYSGSLVLVGKNHDLEISAQISKITVEIKVDEIPRGTLELKHLELNMEGFRVTVDCHVSLHVMVAAAFDKITSTLRVRIKNRLNSVLNEVAKKQITKLLKT